MRRRLHAALLFALLLPWTLPGSAGAEDSPGVRLDNGGFERDDDSDGMPDGWAVFGYQDALPSAAAVGSDGLVRREGARSLRFASLHPIELGGVQSEPIPVEPGERLLLRAWARVANVNPASVWETALGVRFRDYSVYDQEERVVLSPPAVTTEWALVELEFHVPLMVDSLRVNVLFSGAGVLHLDDVTLTTLDPDAQRLPNPGFEQGDGYARHWWMCGGSWHFGGSEGARSLYLGDAGGACRFAFSHWFVLPPGAYVLEGDHLFRGAQGVQVLYDDETLAYEAPLATQEWNLTGPQNGWAHVALPLCAPEGTVAASVVLIGPEAPGFAYWDGLSISRVGDC